MTIRLIADIEIQVEILLPLIFNNRDNFEPSARKISKRVMRATVGLKKRPLQGRKTLVAFDVRDVEVNVVGCLEDCQCLRLANQF